MADETHDGDELPEIGGSDAAEALFDPEMLAGFPRSMDGVLGIERDKGGRFAKGTASPNPLGRPRSEPRMFGMDQTAKDVLALLEQPVEVTKNKKKRQVPAIVAIYDQMIHLAIKGDWNAIKKCIELRERYSQYRITALAKLKEQSDAIKMQYEVRKESRGLEMPEDVKALVEYIDRMTYEGQFTPG